jgi:formylglycine-generating enzyme required for sulfatase activity
LLLILEWYLEKERPEAGNRVEAPAVSSQHPGTRPERRHVPWLWISLTVLLLLAVLSIVIHIVTDTGTIKITGTNLKNEAESKKEAPRPTLVMSPPTLVLNEPGPEKAAPAPGGEPEFPTTRVGQIQLKRIPAGTFQMGSPEGDGDCDDHSQHEVRITRPFYLGVYEVTQGQYQAVMGQNPSRFKRPADLPVEQVSWLDAVKFCNTLSEREGLRPFYEMDGATVSVPDWSGAGFRLPTEAEWEYACRAGSTTRYSFGDDEARLGEFAWFDGNSGGKTHPVGQKGPNGFGFYDMHGNVYEWCWDGFDAYYQQSPTDDPRGPRSAASRVIRGGSLEDGPQGAQSAIRCRSGPENRDGNLGFRVARVPSGR